MSKHRQPSRLRRLRERMRDKWKVARQGVEEFSLVTLNLGNTRELRKFSDQLRGLIYQYGVVVMQEASDRKSLLDLLPEWVGIYFDANIVGSPAVPIAWDSDRYMLLDSFTTELSGREYGGRGAGGDYIKPKVLNVVVLLDLLTGRVRTIGAYHAPASQWNPIRKALAVRQLKKMARETGRIDGPLFIGGDWNTTKLATMRNLLKAGFKWTQAIVKTASHGKRGIDGFAFRAKWWRLVSVKAVKVLSDHKAIVATWRRKARR